MIPIGLIAAAVVTSSRAPRSTAWCFRPRLISLRRTLWPSTARQPSRGSLHTPCWYRARRELGGISGPQLASIRAGGGDQARPSHGLSCRTGGNAGEQPQQRACAKPLVAHRNAARAGCDHASMLWFKTVGEVTAPAPIVVVVQLSSLAR